MSSFPWEIVGFLIVVLFSAGNAIFCLKLSRKVDLYRDALSQKELSQWFNEICEDQLRRFEGRMKGLEAEWEDTYDKFQRLTKRLNGDLGGRPRKQKDPEELPLDTPIASVASNVVPTTNEKEERRRQLRQQARGLIRG